MGPARRLTRRRFGQLALGAGATAVLMRNAYAQVATETPLHGLSAFGDLRYPADFDHFDYASPDAPSGGQMNLAVAYWQFNQSPQAFDTLNTFVLQGNAPPRMEALYDALMTASLDEPDSLYCALAETVSLSKDRNVFTFRLRPQATFSDGKPVTAADVAFSYETLKDKGHPSLVVTLRNVDRVVADDERTVRIVFSGRQNYQDALQAMVLPVLQKAFFAGKDFERVTNEEIVGSGAYRIGRYAFGRFIEYERRDDYWGKELGFARGLGHFKTLRIDFFRDRQPALEAFKKGLITFREEFTSKDWATEYDFPAVRRGAVVKREFSEEKLPRFQCWALNQRRERFADTNVRHAVNLCFDFEWTNTNLMFGQRIHSDSPFQGSEFMAKGSPSEAELSVLEPLRGKIPDEVFGPVWTQPVSDGSGRDRRMLREASNLFAKAGWANKGGKLTNEKGEIFRLEFLIRGAEQQRVYTKMIDNLKLLGADASLRLVDEAQYQDRLNRYDYDMMLAAFSLGATPTRESLSIFFGSDAADRPGAYNYPGMASEAVDSLITRAGAATSREELSVVLSALDRVLRWRLDWLPNITAEGHRAAYWDMFGFKEPKPDYSWPVESLWWFDAEKAKAIGKA